MCEVEFTHRDECHAASTKIRESPSLTPRNNGTRIEALGHTVDRRLKAGDVRLTMGGEPTFVSIDDMDGAEWTIAAPGTHQAQAGRHSCSSGCGRALPPTGFLHYGQGKWYPGESLPRWALSCYWRSDGLPLWQDPELIADEEKALGLRRRKTPTLHA